MLQELSVSDHMNWLAHLFISEKSIDFQLGNLLADPLKGKSWEGASRQLEAGLKMHSCIDSFTDSNVYVSKSKSRLRSKGYLKSVIIDIAYDYLLIKNWNDYSKISLECFIHTFYTNAGVAIEEYPDDARHFVQRLIDYRVLNGYGSFRGLETAFRRVDNRLSGRILAKESAVEYLPVLKREITGIEKDFSCFFPQLVEYFRSKVESPLEDHWLK